ncbi:hypothetical protein HY449_03505 [Candidatus Pacearchaeota archaeon]|nr:hypothetical protein [Candidatus Pacearchaeota archaeon]
MKKRGFLVKNKKGISDIVTYLLIIVISMIALGILWVIVANFLSQGGEQVSLQGITISLGIKSAQIFSDDVSIRVSRGAGEGDLRGVKFIFSDGSKTESFDDKTALGQLEEKTFNFNLQELENSELKTVSVAPIYFSAGKETIGNIVDTFQFSQTQISGETDVTGTGEETGGATCGDHQCVSPENAASCSADCRSDNIGGVCENNICEAGENSVSCPNDCNNENPVCGDAQCVSPESISSCPADCSTCVPETCAEIEKQCGSWSSARCGGTIECSPCASGDYCTDDGKCLQDAPLNFGTIDGVWPIGAAKYFDSESLPKTPSEISGYIGKYVKFITGSEAGNCRKIEYAENLNVPGVYDKSYLRIEVVVNINGGNGYEVWRSSSCGGIA